MEFAHDVFVSYASADRNYAQKVSDALRALDSPYTTFFDVDSLRAGDDWETRIQGALESSRHMVVLWSDHARGSDWVSLETTSFRLTAKPQKDPGRRLVFVNLAGMNQAMKLFQQINQAQLQASYPSHDDVDDAVWVSLIREINKGLDPNTSTLPVPLVVLTLTHAELAGIGAERWARLKEDFQLTEAFLLARYGSTRGDWRPFASSEPIGDVLAAIRSHVNSALQGYHVDWQTPDDAFWTDELAARKFVVDNFETAKLAVLIVDPVALYHPDIYPRLMLFQQCLSRTRTVIVTLPPFGIPRRILRLRDALVKRGTSYFYDYFNPVVPPRLRLAAQFGWNMSDRMDIQRLILAAAGELAAETEARPPSTFLRHGGRR